MINFRDLHPMRRNPVPRYSQYRKYKTMLQEDFNSKCGYCDDADCWCGGRREFHIDHFVPRVLLKTIKLTDYINLVYSCPYCNNSKLDDWPCHDERVHNDGRTGYIDPCHAHYCLQFSRNASGEIGYCSELGKYMYNKLNLSLRRHSVIWNLQRLRHMLKELKALKTQGKLSTKGLKEYTKLLEDYQNYTDELHQVNNE